MRRGQHTRRRHHHGRHRYLCSEAALRNLKGPDVSELANVPITSYESRTSSTAASEHGAPSRFIRPGGHEVDAVITGLTASFASPFATRGGGRLAMAADALARLAIVAATFHDSEPQLVNLEAITEQVLERLAPLAARTGVRVVLRPGPGRKVIRCSASAVMRLLGHLAESQTGNAGPSDCLVVTIRKFIVATTVGGGSTAGPGERVAVHLATGVSNIDSLDTTGDSLQDRYVDDARCADLLGHRYAECRKIADACDGHLWAASSALGGIGLCVDFPAADATRIDQTCDELG